MASTGVMLAQMNIKQPKREKNFPPAAFATACHGENTALWRSLEQKMRKCDDIFQVSKIGSACD